MIKKYGFIIFIIFIILLFELFIFNFQSLKSYILDYKEKNFETTINYDTEKKQTIVEVTGINEKVHNIYFDYKSKEPETIEHEILIDYTDESFSDYDKLYGTREHLVHYINFTYDRSKYINCDFQGKTEKIRIIINSKEEIKVNKFSINKKIPYNFNIIRFISLISIICFIYSLLTANFFKEKFNINNRKQSLFLYFIGIIFISLLCIMKVNIDDSFVNSIRQNKAYSISYVRAIRNGQLNIPTEQYIVDTISNLENPYDYSAVNKENIDDFFDHAFYEGKVYLYYGILPLIVLLLPLNLLFGEYISVALGTLIFLIIGSIYTVKFVKEIIYRYFKDVPFSLVVLFVMFMLFNNKIIGLMARPFVYEFVMAAGYCFVMAGLYYFLKYLRENKKKFLLISCTLMALAVAGRPPTLFISIIIFIKLGYDIIKNIKNKKEVISTLSLSLTPYVIVGILLMIFNYLRFENIFEFGSNYQISVTDFRTFGTDLNRILIGVSSYFLSDVDFMPIFPFVTGRDWMPEYNGFYYSQSICGGYFATTLIGIIILLAPYLLKKIKKENKEMYYLIIINILLAIFIAVFEANKCGSVSRYLNDFFWLLNTSTMLLLLFIYKKLKTKEHKDVFIKIMTFFIVISCFINTFMIYSYEHEMFKSEYNINTYYFVKYMTSFWL